MRLLFNSRPNNFLLNRLNAYHSLRLHISCNPCTGHTWRIRAFAVARSTAWLPWYQGGCIVSAGGMLLRSFCLCRVDCASWGCRLGRLIGRDARRCGLHVCCMLWAVVLGWGVCLGFGFGGCLPGPPCLILISKCTVVVGACLVLLLGKGGFGRAEIALVIYYILSTVVKALSSHAGRAVL